MRICVNMFPGMKEDSKKIFHYYLPRHIPDVCAGGGEPNAAERQERLLVSLFSRVRWIVVEVLLLMLIG